MCEFMDSEAAVADEDDLTTRQPARQLQCTLPGPVGQQLVTVAARSVRSLRRGEQRQNRQSLDKPGP